MLLRVFLPGLSPSTLSAYAHAMSTNYYSKRLLFTDVKTAVARADGIYDVIENATGLTVGISSIRAGDGITASPLPNKPQLLGDV